MRVAVTGATGLIGRRVMADVRQAGDEAVGLRRGREGEQTWNVQSGEIRTDGSVDALVQLAGRAIWAGVRWTKRVRREIWESRVTATEKLCGFLGTLPREQRPKVMICASGVGIYGSRGDEMLTEDSAPAPANATFLSDVCRGWEAATKPAEEAGIRVIHLRLGVVLTKEGGALAKLVTPTKLFLGGPVGSGRQYMPWISLTDASRLILRLLQDSEVRGAVNAVAPNPARQQEFIRTLGKVLHRPTVFPMPALVVKLLFGQMGNEALLMSQRVRGARIPQDFRFEHPTVEAALRAELCA